MRLTDSTSRWPTAAMRPPIWMSDAYVITCAVAGALCQIDRGGAARESHAAFAVDLHRESATAPSRRSV
jgi:hypothetical protein